MAKSRGRGPTLAKDVNRMLIYRQLKQMRSTTRVELSTVLQLNKNTINSIIDELITAGYVNEKGLSTTLGLGRKPVMIAFHAANKYSVGATLSSAAIHWAVTDLYAKPMETFTTELQNCSPESIVDTLCEGVQQLLERYPATAWVGFDIGIPGQLDSERKIVLQSSHLHWNQVPLAALLGSRLTVPFRLDHSVKLAALGELWHGHGREADHFAYCSFGDGIGCGIVMGGTLIRGEGNLAGELGHIVVDPQGPVCRCGNQGCLEAIAGIPAILGRLDQTGEREQNTHNMNWLQEQLRAGNPAVEQDIRRTGMAIGRAFSHIVNLINPKLIICDGPLMLIADYLFPIIGEELAACSTPPAYRHVQLVCSTLYPYTGCIGAAASAIQDWESNVDPLELVSG
ncbi:ROK family protein [Paenibacillus monticola]|uniref:ROK family protein n=1 Tax=Paenibacillus monticola TaxID=2666075 RepID=A0A7X2H7D0_9BACL|nr:ROK family protein [Paenibacillus monticola]MRN54785.1 ROK family protein [Paenibacillus monticola]